MGEKGNREGMGEERKGGMERGRDGKRESGRDEEREKGRDGERERGRDGVRERRGEGKGCGRYVIMLQACVYWFCLLYVYICILIGYSKKIQVLKN